MLSSSPETRGGDRLHNFVMQLITHWDPQTQSPSRDPSGGLSLIETDKFNLSEICSVLEKAVQCAQMHCRRIRQQPHETLAQTEALYHEVFALKNIYHLLTLKVHQYLDRHHQRPKKHSFPMERLVQAIASLNIFDGISQNQHLKALLKKLNGFQDFIKSFSFYLIKRVDILYGPLHIDFHALISPKKFRLAKVGDKNIFGSFVINQTGLSAVLQPSLAIGAGSAHLQDRLIGRLERAWPRAQGDFVCDDDLLYENLRGQGPSVLNIPWLRFEMGSIELHYFPTVMTYIIELLRQNPFEGLIVEGRRDQAHAFYRWGFWPHENDSLLPSLQQLQAAEPEEALEDDQGEEPRLYFLPKHALAFRVIKALKQPASKISPTWTEHLNKMQITGNFSWLNFMGIPSALPGGGRRTILSLVNQRRLTGQPLRRPALSVVEADPAAQSLSEFGRFLGFQARMNIEPLEQPSSLRTFRIRL